MGYDKLREAFENYKSHHRDLERMMLNLGEERQLGAEESKIW